METCGAEMPESFSMFWLHENKNKDETKIRATVFLPQKEANRVLFMRKLLASRVLRRGGKNIHLKKVAKSRYSDLFFKSLLAKKLTVPRRACELHTVPLRFYEKKCSRFEKKIQIVRNFLSGGNLYIARIGAAAKPSAFGG